MLSLWSAGAGLLTGACVGPTPPAPPPVAAAPLATPEASGPLPAAEAGHGATCDGGVRCPGDRPVCSVAPDGSTCVSVALGDQTPHDGRHLAFACTRAADCDAGLRCCTAALGDRSRCSEGCDIANELDLCASDAECGGMPSACARLDVSELALEMPGWIKACRNGDDGVK